MIQSILFDKKHYSKTKAQTKLKQMGYKLLKGKKMHETDNKYRFRILDPSDFAYFSSNKLNNGITLIRGFK